MDKAEFRQLCQSHGLKMVSDVRAVGDERGYLITLQWAGKKNISLNLPTGDGDAKQHAKELKARLKETFGKNATVNWSDQTKILTVFLSDKNIPDVYCQGIRVTLDAVKNLGVARPDKCCVCGGSGCDAAIPRGGVYAPVHRACLEKAVSGAQDKADSNARHGSYLLGTVGAFLGALVGVLPSALTILLAERIYVILFMLIPLCSYMGYRLCRGRMNYFALVVAVIFSVLGVYLLNFGVTLYSLADAFKLGLGDAIALFPYMLIDPDVWTEVSKSEDFIKCLLFVAAGIFLAWGMISRTARTDVKDAKGVLDSAIPLVPSQPEGLSYDPADPLSAGHAPEDGGENAPAE